MAMVVSNRRRIFYTFEGDKGPFLLLHHGLFGSHQDWYKWGFVDALASEYRLIIPDARGHGRSDKPEDVGDYSLENFTGDVVAILDELGVRNVQFFGHSFASMIGLRFILNYPDRARGGMLGGESPLPNVDYLSDLHQLREKIEIEGLTQVVNERRDQKDLIITSRDYDEAEQTAGIALLNAMQDWPDPEEENISTAAPLTLFIGAMDAAIPRMKAARSRLTRSRLFIMGEISFADAVIGREAMVREMTATMRSSKPPGDRQEGRDQTTKNKRSTQERSGKQANRQERSNKERRENERENQDRRKSRTGSKHTETKQVEENEDTRNRLKSGVENSQKINPDETNGETGQSQPPLQDNQRHQKQSFDQVPDQDKAGGNSSLSEASNSDMDRDGENNG